MKAPRGHRDHIWRSVVLAAGVVVSITLVYLAVRDVNVEMFRRAIADSSPVWFVPALAALAVGTAVRVVRWRYLFDETSRPPARAATHALLAGELFNSILPLRGGEVARVLILHRDTRVSRAEAGATVVAERLLDVVVLLLLVFATLPFAPDATWLRTAAILLGVALAAVLALVAVLRRFGTRPLAAIGRRLAPGSGTEFADRVVNGVRAFRSARAGALAVALTFVAWLTVGAACWFVLQAVHIDLGYEAGILVTAATAFALVLPAAPASVGVFEAAVLVALHPYGVGEARALAYAVVLHVVTFAPFIVAGLVALRPLRDRPGRPAAVRSEAAASRMRP
jgi:uncharacterized protein (TIRG00374 family)